jgi:hypothetical protein
VEDEAAELLLREELLPGDTLEVTEENGALRLSVHHPAALASTE